MSQIVQPQWGRRVPVRTEKAAPPAPVNPDAPTAAERLAQFRARPGLAEVKQRWQDLKAAPDAAAEERRAKLATMTPAELAAHFDGEEAAARAARATATDAHAKARGDLVDGQLERAVAEQARANELNHRRSGVKCWPDQLAKLDAERAALRVAARAAADEATKADAEGGE